MKLILDTNVLVSGIFFGGIPGKLLSAWRSGRVSLILSPAILAEYRRVAEELASSHREVGEALEPLLALVTIEGTIVDAPALKEPVCEDPADDMFLAAALASRTNFIVSGDKHLLRVSGWQGITVLTPRQFLDQHLGGVA